MTTNGRPLTPIEMQRRNQLKAAKPLVYDKVIQYEEKFRNGESIAIIQLQYDYACNFRCRHCSISDLRIKNGRRSLSIDDLRDLSRQADDLGLAHIDITGGEPLVFPDLDDLIDAIQPEKFYIQMDTNGWLMTPEKAHHLKNKGVDKIQLSLDSIHPEAHDDFRRTARSHEKALRAIDAIKGAGLNLQIATVVTHHRIRTQEFLDFLEFAKDKGAGVAAIWAKPVGEWSGKTDLLATDEDFKYLAELRKQYNVYDHLTPQYGLNIGCIAVKRMISITKYGDVLPCPWIYYSLGNIFREPLGDILSKGMTYYAKYQPRCLVSSANEFLENYLSNTAGRMDLPLPIENISLKHHR